MQMAVNTGDGSCTLFAVIFGAGFGTAIFFATWPSSGAEWVPFIILTFIFGGGVGAALARTKDGGHVDGRHGRRIDRDGGHDGGGRDSDDDSGDDDDGGHDKGGGHDDGKGKATLDDGHMVFYQIAGKPTHALHISMNCRAVGHAKDFSTFQLCKHCCGELGGPKPKITTRSS